MRQLLEDMLAGYVRQLVIQEPGKDLEVYRADTIRDTYCKNYIVAMAKGDTTGAQAVLDSIAALNDNLYKAMEAINNG